MTTVRLRFQRWAETNCVRNVATILCLLVLTGCATYEPRPIEPARTATRLEARSLDDPGLRTAIFAAIAAVVGLGAGYLLDMRKG